MDLTPLCPTSDTPHATNEAIERCLIAGRGCLAMIEQLRQARAGLLMVGHPDQLRRNTRDLESAMADGQEIRDLVDHLQARLRELAPEQTAEIAAQARAIDAAAAMSSWWSDNAGLVMHGLQLMGLAFAALGELQVAVRQTSAAAEAARAIAHNVTPLRPHPAA